MRDRPRDGRCPSLGPRSRLRLRDLRGWGGGAAMINTNYIGPCLPSPPTCRVWSTFLFSPPASPPRRTRGQTCCPSAPPPPPPSLRGMAVNGVPMYSPPYPRGMGADLLSLLPFPPYLRGMGADLRLLLSGLSRSVAVTFLTSIERLLLSTILSAIDREPLLLPLCEPET